ncbi:unnamed protein product [Nippostrongylus brasiliensis]|uniref:Reverse transcriptase domain-containing protein n=1 Tax=Nippostrongylus brasiliensis TaxID=27835 RepID=A0A0N4Y3C0_NIPBR|nr:unnamed protein product [Nippostrongylus brasiliensis]
MSMRIDTKEGCWIIISVCAPQTGCPDKEKVEFYGALDDVIRSVSEDDFLTIAGDLSGHIGSRARPACTFFAKRDNQETAYFSGGRKMEVDHILVRRQYLKAVKDVKLLPGDAVATQHRPLVVTWLEAYAGLNAMVDDAVDTGKSVMKSPSAVIGKGGVDRKKLIVFKKLRKQNKSYEPPKKAELTSSQDHSEMQH